RAREPCPASPGHDLPGRCRGGRTRADRLHLCRAGHEPTERLRGSRRAGAVARRHLLLRVPRDRTLAGDPAALPRKSFILDRQRGTYLVRSGNDTTFLPWIRSRLRPWPSSFRAWPASHGADGKRSDRECGVVTGAASAAGTETMLSWTE